MPIAFFKEGEEKALNHLRGAMSKFEFGSPEYEIARRAYGFIANKVISRRRLDQEHERDNRGNR